MLYRVVRACLRVSPCGAAIALALSCGDPTSPTRPNAVPRTVVAHQWQELPEHIIRARRTCYFTVSAWECYGDDNTYHGPLDHPQIRGSCLESPDICGFFDQTWWANPTVDYQGMSSTDGDYVGEEPDCSSPQFNIHFRAYCSGYVAAASTDSGSVAATRILAATGRMRALGGVCAQIADIVDRVLQREKIRIYTDAVSEDGGFALVGGGSEGALSFMGVNEKFIKFAHENPSKGDPRMNLQFVLAHEGDHLAGNPHLPGTPYFTANTNQCSGLGPQ